MFVSKGLRTSTAPHTIDHLQGKGRARNTPHRLLSEEDSTDLEDSSDSDEEGVQEDYLANLQGGSDSTNSDHLQVFFPSPRHCLSCRVLH